LPWPSRPGAGKPKAPADIHPSVILGGKVAVGAFTKIDSGTVLTGNITIGHHTLIRRNTVIRGTNVIGNYTHIRDNVNIEGGRPAKVGGSKAQTPDRSLIGGGCWINHGATVHGARIADGACDYNTHIGKGAILANGSATHVDQENQGQYPQFRFSFLRRNVTESAENRD
jgi:carbonic anhydrase/acetyltransferase-like protein (isoleucine patch superfamily)